MSSKPEIIFTFPSCMGGVASFNFNIINHNTHRNKCFIKIILLKEEEDSRPLFLDKFLADEVVYFNYSKYENQYCVFKRLNSLLGLSEGAIVTDNSLTIYAARTFNNPKTIFQLVHDYFYVNENIQFGDLVDVVVTHSSFFGDAVFAANPLLYAGRTFYIPYGVKQLDVMPFKNNSILNLVFLGRLDQGKGVDRLFEMDELLISFNVLVKWSIIGKGPLKNSLLKQWQYKQNIVFFEPDSTQEVYNILMNQDVFILPTLFEGTPVSILECLANAVVPIVNDLPGGIRDIVNIGIGYRCELNNLAQFVEYIVLLDKDRELLKIMQDGCYGLSRTNYDIERNAKNYFELFLEFKKFKRPEKISSIKKSMLDSKLIPNNIVKMFRSIRK